MKEEFRKTGIDFMGDLPWGTHLCQFYQSKEDLIKILIPYFKAGLENNEFCMWVCSEPLKTEGAKATLKKVVKNLDDYVKNGQIEILDASEWYTKSGKFDADRVLQGWVEKENQAIKRGFDGLRLTGNTFWLEKRDWRSFIEYERAVNDVIRKYRMLAICTYNLDKCGPIESIDVISTHQFALIRRESKWELMENAERRRAEERMKTLTAIVNEAKVPITTVDLDGIITTWNKSCEEMLGYSAEETIGKIPLSKMCPKTDEQIQVTLKEGYCLDKELEYLAKDGRAIPCSTSTFLLKDEAGDPVGVGGIAIDISERKKTEKALIQSEKLRALGEMAGGVAHDFNNLLAIILGNAQLLERGLKRYKEEEIKDRLQTIARTAYEGGETVRRLQHFTGREVSSRDFTKIDLNEIVRSAISSTSPRWKDEAEAKGVTIEIKERLGKLPPLLGSRSELMEVLTNLMFNSVESMREGGEITIRTEARQNEILLYFTDTGKGVPHRIKGKIFDPFFTTKGPKASGLGLSICYGIVKRHKGKIKVESIEGKGTIFTISIPIPLEVPQDEEKLKEVQKISSRKILIIDDEEGVRNVLGGIFQHEGHRVTLAETGKEGLEEFKQGDFNLVLTNLGMPEMSGWEVAKRIKKIDPDMPVGLITGWAVATPKEKMKEEGVDFILSKPFDLIKVVREVNAALTSRKR